MEWRERKTENKVRKKTKNEKGGEMESGKRGIRWKYKGNRGK